MARGPEIPEAGFERYGGDPNAIAKPEVPPSRLETPLIAAVHSLNLENVKILIHAGADPDYSDGCRSALEAAFDLGQIEMVRYLVIDRKVNLVARDCKTLAGEEITILTHLREAAYPLDSSEYRVKMEIID